MMEDLDEPSLVPSLEVSLSPVLPSFERPRLEGRLIEIASEISLSELIIGCYNRFLCSVIGSLENCWTSEEAGTGAGLRVTIFYGVRVTSVGSPLSAFSSTLFLFS